MNQYKDRAPTLYKSFQVYYVSTPISYPTRAGNIRRVLDHNYIKYWLVENLSKSAYEAKNE